jgi:hypothetical protein
MGFGFGRNWTDRLLDAQKDLDAVLRQMAQRAVDELRRHGAVGIGRRVAEGLPSLRLVWALITSP